MSPTTATVRPAFEDRTETLFESLRSYWRPALYALLGVLVIAAVVAIYYRSKASNAARAQQALYDAQRAVIAGNATQAQRDLQNVASRYEGTAAAVQATISLAQIRYEEGKPADGLRILQDADKHRAAADYRATIRGLIAAGYEQQGKHADAAREYEQAADVSRFELDRANYQASAARAYMTAGNKDAAKGIWSRLAADPTGPVAAEARVRLGELNAAPAAR
jgi:predicted negative regulator of RcsB-dependent stress response